MIEMTWEEKQKIHDAIVEVYKAVKQRCKDAGYPVHGTEILPGSEKMLVARLLPFPEEFSSATYAIQDFLGSFDVNQDGVQHYEFPTVK